MFGPLLRHEWMMLTRRGTHTRLRVGFVLVLLTILFVMYSSTFPNLRTSQILTASSQLVPLKVAADFTERFTCNFLLVQYLAVLLITPLFAIGTITEDRDKRRLDFLLTTDLSPSEILLGKLAARAAWLLLFLLTGLPILAVSRVWGGVEIETLLLGYALLLSLMLFTLAHSTLLAARGHSPAGVLGRVCALQFCLFLTAEVLSSFFDGSVKMLSGWSLIRVVLLNLDWSSPRILWVVLHLCGTLAVSAMLLRETCRAFRRSLFVLSISRTRKFRPEIIPPLTPQRMSLNHPEVEDEPFLWKELYFPNPRRNGPISPILMIFFVVTISSFGLCLLSGILLGSREIGVVALGLLVLWWCLPAWLAILPVILRERQQQTLEMLLSLPVDRWEILEQKCEAASRRNHWQWPALIGCIFLLAQAVPFVRVPLLLLFAVTLRYFGLSLGVWLSVRCRTGIQVGVIFVVVALALSLLPEIAGGYLKNQSGSAAEDTQAVEIVRALSPVRAWVVLAGREKEPNPSSAFQSFTPVDQATLEREKAIRVAGFSGALVCIGMLALAGRLLRGEAAAILEETGREYPEDFEAQE